MWMTSLHVSAWDLKPEAGIWDMDKELYPTLLCGMWLTIHIPDTSGTEILISLDR